MSEHRERGRRARQRGADAESEAVAWLERRGYRVVERNHRTKAGEIDVVAWHGRTLCFIEIKARSSSRWQKAVESLSAAQRHRLVKAASLYLLQFGANPPACRFDLLTLDGAGGEGVQAEGNGRSEWRFTLIESAFEAG